MRSALIVLVVPSVLAVGSVAAQAQSPCIGIGTNCEIVEVPTSISYKRVAYTGVGTDVGKYRSADCDPAFEVVADRYLTRGSGSDATEYYSGSFCFPTGTIPGETQITSAILMDPILLPPIEVHHNPHGDEFVANIPTWFWHEGPATHTQTQRYDLDALTSITAVYEGRIVSWCWTVDDTRSDLPPRELGGTPCDAAPPATTYVNSQPGNDSAEGAAATHTFTERGYTSGITVEAVWTGTLTITDGPDGIRGTTLDVLHTVTRARVDVPIRQIIPVLVPNE